MRGFKMESCAHDQVCEAGQNPDPFQNYSPDPFQNYSPDPFQNYNPDPFQNYSPFQNEQTQIRVRQSKGDISV